MWQKNKKAEDDWQTRVDDCESDLQLLREERDELKAWCDELQSRQRQLGFSQQVFQCWNQSMADLRVVRQSGIHTTQALSNINRDFLSHHLAYRESRKTLLKYVAEFTDSYKQADNSRENIFQVQLHAEKLSAGLKKIDSISERLRLLSLNVAIESAQTTAQYFRESISITLREISEATKVVAADISILNQRIEVDNKKTDGYFNTVTDGFIGFSRAISPLLEAADQSAELILSMATIIGEWTTDNLLQSMKVEHILWKFTVYSQLLGVSNEAPFSCDGGLSHWPEHWSSMVSSGHLSIEAALEKVSGVAKNLARQYQQSEFTDVLVQLQALEQASAELFIAFDQLPQSMVEA